MVGYKTVFLFPIWHDNSYLFGHKFFTTFYFKDKSKLAKNKIETYILNLRDIKISSFNQFWPILFLSLFCHSTLIV